MNTCENCGQLKETIQIVVQDPLFGACRKVWSSADMALQDTMTLIHIVDREQAIRQASVAVAE